MRGQSVLPGGLFGDRTVVARCLGDWGLGVQISRSVLSQSQNWHTAADIRAFVAAVENTSLANGERFSAWKT